MKKLVALMSFLVMMLLAPNALAVAGNANQNQAQTQNQGEETQLQNKEQEQSQTGEQTGTQTQTQTQSQLQIHEPQYMPKNQNSYQHMYQMQANVANMLNFSYQLQNQGLASQIQTIAQNQIQSEDKVNQAIDKAEARGSVAKFFLGPDYKQLKLVKEEMEQNRLRIQELNQIMTQLSNQDEQSQLQNIIQTLEMQNTELQNQLNAQTQGFSLLGWLFRWINKY